MFAAALLLSLTAPTFGIGRPAVGQPIAFPVQIPPAEKENPVVTRYDLRFAFRLKENRLEADTWIAVKNNTSRPIPEIPFLLYRLFDVHEAVDGTGAALPFAQTVVKFSDERSLQANLVLVRLKTPLLPEKDVSVRLKYEGTLWGYPEVMAYVKDRIDENYSLLRPDALAYPILAGASFRSLMAAFRSAFTYRVQAEVPAGYLVACGGRLLEPEKKAESTVFRFESFAPTWRVDVAAARFKVIEDQGAGIRIYALPEDEGEARRILEAARRSFRFFSEKFGEIGDLPGFAIIEVPDGWGSQAAGYYVLQAAAAFRDEGRTSELYHEIAHNWNAKAKPAIQRCRYFDEAFASYFQGLAIREFEGEEAFEKFMTRLRDRFLQSCDRDEKNGSTPIAEYWREERGENSYTKGAWSLFVLHQAVGDEVFMPLVSDLIREFRVRKVDFKEFEQTAERAAGRSLDLFFKDWIFGVESTRLLREQMNVVRIAERYR